MSSYEHLKLCAARYVWPIKNQYTPIGKIKWSTWWSRKFGEDYFEYVERVKK